MQFFDVVERRRSVRKFAARQIEPDDLDAILAAARLAPSAGDCQAYSIAVTETEGMKARLAVAAGQDFIAEAPFVLVFAADPERSAKNYGERGASLFSVQDATIAAAYAQLAATALGLATCWVGAFDETRVAELCGLTAIGLRPVALLPLGYADETPERTARRPLDGLVRREGAARSDPGAG
jgi:nitroreductase